MRLYIILILIITSTSFVSALVDVKSGNYSKGFVDFKIGSSTFPLTLKRTYNSRTLYRGLFGMGWCSNLETKIEILPEGVPRVTICGGGVGISYSSDKNKPSASFQANQIMKVVREQNKNLSSKDIKRIRKGLTNPGVRREYMRAYSIKGKLNPKVIYYPHGGIKEGSIRLKRNQFIRTLKGGIRQTFNKEGRLIKLSDRLGNYNKIVWKGSKVIQIIDDKGRRLNFNYKNDSILIKDGGRKLSSYTMKDGNLVFVQTPYGIHQYAYDSFHNLTKRVFIPNSQREKSIEEHLTYNTKKDLVKSFTHSNKCMETYDYKTNSRNSNHYWTTLEKKCGKDVVTSAKYEYWNKPNKTGGLYLHRARQEVNKEVKDVTYDKDFFRVVKFVHNGVTTKYSYYKSGKFKGLIKTKKNPGYNVEYVSYHPQCRKPTLVSLQPTLQLRSLSQNRTKKLKIKFSKLSCLTKKIARSDGPWITLNHDTKGRIVNIKDQSGKNIVIDYHSKFDVPVKISQVGVGSVRINVNPRDGSSRGFAKNSDHVTILNIMNVYRGFLDMISPIASEVRI